MASYTGTGRDATRIQHLEEERKRKKEELDRQKNAISEASATGYKLGENFVSYKESMEDLLKQNTVGLVSFDDFKAKRQHFEQRAAQELEKREAERREKESIERKNRLKKANKAQLSFAEEEDEEESDGDDFSAVRSKPDEKGTDGTDDPAESAEPELSAAQQAKKRKFGKNPSIDTTFLPDRDRELEEKAERERLKQEWENEQRKMKEQVMKITYSYWDGSGHRRQLSCKMGTTIGKFLAMVQLEFHELRNVSADMLMFIKEDLIIPHHYSFYDFVVTKARGKSGPLFNFDVHDDIRLVNDASKEKEDAHAGKVVERRWYERNKHIFPASRWEVYDRNKKYDKYTIRGGEVN